MKFSPQSRVWVYQSNRILTDAEVKSIQQELDNFCENWLAHGNELKAKASILYNVFIILTVDESGYGATGCSIDSSVKIIKKIEADYNLDLLNRFNMAYKIDDKIIIVNKEDFESLISIKKVDENTIVFNNMVQTLEEFETKWEVPFKESWHAQIFGHLV